jgi:hypothetical protein
MVSPLVIEYLRTKSFQQLEDEHGVCARPNSTFDKFSLNYDQILVKNGDPVAEQCRGMVVRPHLSPQFWLACSDWKSVPVGACDVLAWPMNRFYNHGDAAGADVDWSDPGLRVYEKLDGTMMVVYWDPLQGRWHAGTRSVPEADLPIRVGHMEIGDMTFSELFFKALRETREAAEGKPLDWEPTDFDKVVHLNKELTYVFELTTPYNRIVVKYDEPRVTLLAARHTATGRELPIESLRLQHVNRPKTWDLRSAAALDAFVNSADPSLLEGAVVCDSQFRRLKVKNKAWVLSSKAKDLVTVSRRSALLAIVKGEIDDVIPIVEKDIADELCRMQSALRDYMLSIDRNFSEFKARAAGSRKDFALMVTSSGDWTPPYFNMWEGRATTALGWAQAAAANGKLSDSTLDAILGRLDKQG